LIAANIDNRQSVSHITNLRAQVIGVTLTKLAFCVIAPALHVAVFKEHASCFSTSINATNRNARPTNIYARKHIAHLSSTITTFGVVTIAMLARRILPPAFDAGIVQKSARMFLTCCHFHSRAACA